MTADLSVFVQKAKNAGNYLRPLSEMIRTGERVIDVTPAGEAGDRILVGRVLFAMTDMRLIIVRASMLSGRIHIKDIDLRDVIGAEFDPGPRNAKPGLRDVVTINTTSGDVRLNISGKKGPRWPRIIMDQVHALRHDDPPRDSADDIAAQARRLADLRTAGLLSDGEYAAAMARLPAD